MGAPSQETLSQTHKTIRAVTAQIEQYRFNLAVAEMMNELNYLSKLKPEELGRFAIESHVVMLAPMAPHITEVLWRELGHSDSVHLEPWPKFDEALTRDETVTVVVQIEGKVRERLQVEVGATEEAVKALALESEAVIRHLAGRTPKKFIFVPNKMLSIVV